jgi:hypothetical protein
MMWIVVLRARPALAASIGHVPEMNSYGEMTSRKQQQGIGMCFRQKKRGEDRCALRRENGNVSVWVTLGNRIKAEPDKVATAGRTSVTLLSRI